MRDIKGKNNPFYGKKHSKSSKKKMSVSHSGKILSDGHKKNIKESLLGRDITWKDKISKAHKGKKLSEETKTKLREYNTKNPTNYWLGKKRPPISLETREKLSNSMKGEKCYNWKGGKLSINIKIRELLEYRLWREKIFKRDKFLCQMPGCNMKEKFFEAHHIEKFSSILSKNKIKTTEQALNCKELWDTNNGITLCKRCHNKIKRQENKYSTLFKEIINLLYDDKQQSQS